MSDPTVLETPQTNEDWQRVSPIAIIFFIIKFGIRFVKEGLLNFAPALAVFITQVDDKWFWLGIVLSVLAVFLVIYSVLYFRTFRFLIEPDQITLERGVLKQEKTILKFEKVQNVNLSTPFYFAPFNLVNCIFDSAGSSQQEISFPGIAKEFAEKIRTDVMAYRRQAAKSTNKDPSASETVVMGDESSSVLAEADASNERLKLNIKDLTIYGLSSNMAFLALAVLAPFMNHIVDFTKENVVPGLLVALEGLFPSVQIAKVAAVFIIIFSFIAVALLLSIASAIVQFYGFTFYDEGKNLRRVAGLLDSHQISLSKHRVQAITIKQNFIMRWFKRVTVQFNQLATGHANNAKSKNNLSIPSLPQDKWPAFVSDSFDGLDVQKLNFLSISKRYISKVFLFFWFLPISLATLGLIQLHFNWIWLLTIVPAGFFLTLLRYKRFGLWFNDDFIAIRSGLFGSKISILPLYKTQHMSMTQSPMMRRKNLASISLQLPFGTRTLPYLPLNLAQAAINLGCYRVESSTKHWL